MIRYVPANVYYCNELVNNLRAADRAEVEAARGHISALQLWFDIRDARDCSVALDDRDRVVCLFGVSDHPMQKEVGIVWLLGTDLLDKHMFQLCKEAKAKLSFWHLLYPILTNFTDLRNKRVLRWLQWLGFSFGSVINIRDHDFIQFTSNCHV